jgi:acetoin utilization protein AcuB
MKRPIREFMTPTPQTIGLTQPLEVAHRLMREHDIRHLPVLDRGRLVGLVSERDLHFIETLRGIDQGVVPVAEAMTPEPFTVRPDAPIDQVVRRMAAKKYGSCVIVDRSGKVDGVFTTVDALRILADVFSREQPNAQAATRPGRPSRPARA